MKDISDYKLRPRLLTNVFTAGRPGRYQLQAANTTVVTASGYTTVQAGDYFSFEIGIPNLGPAMTVKVSWSLASASGADDVIAVTPAGGAWSAGISVAVAAGGTYAGLNSETEVITYSTVTGARSLARTDSPTQARALVAWRVQFPSGAQISVPNLGSYYWWFENQVWPMMKSNYQPVAGVDTPANYTNTVRAPEGNPSGAINPFYPVIRYTSSKWGKQIIMCGDSIVEGLGGNARFYGAVQRSCSILSTPNNPIEWFNCGQHAQTPDTYSATLAQHILAVQPTAVFYEPYSINQVVKSATSTGLTPTAKAECYRGLAALSKACNSLPRPAGIFILEPLPNALYDSASGNGATTAANDSIRQAFITELATYGGDATPVLATTTGLMGVSIMRQGMTPVLGLAAAWSNPTAVNGQLVPKSDAIGTDFTHPNETGFSRDLEPVCRLYVEAA